EVVARDHHCCGTSSPELASVRTRRQRCVVIDQDRVLRRLAEPMQFNAVSRDTDERAVLAGLDVDAQVAVRREVDGLLHRLELARAVRGDSDDLLFGGFGNRGNREGDSYECRSEANADHDLSGVLSERIIRGQTNLQRVTKTRESVPVRDGAAPPCYPADHGAALPVSR